MNKYEVFVIAMAESESQRGHYVLILEEPISKRRIPIIVGTNEAQAIAIHLEGLQPSRPLTHDLCQTIIQQLGAKAKEVCIYQIQHDIFYAKLLLQGPKELVEIESRPSDAIALAVRMHCPLYVSDQVSEEAGYVLDEKGREKKSYAEYTLEELEGEAQQEQREPCRGWTVRSSGAQGPADQANHVRTGLAVVRAGCCRSARKTAVP